MSLPPDYNIIINTVLKAEHDPSLRGQSSRAYCLADI
jgi:hypothetical protein